MKSRNNIKKLVQKIHFAAGSEMRSRILGDVLKAHKQSKNAESAKDQPNIWIIIAKSRITKLAAVVVVALTFYFFSTTDRDEFEQRRINKSSIAVNSQTPAELTSVISLNIAFRDGDMEAMEKQFVEAEKKVGPQLRERITINQLLCELKECEEI